EARSTGSRRSSCSSTSTAEGSASSKRDSERLAVRTASTASSTVEGSAPATKAILPVRARRYPWDMPRVRVALCQLNTVVGDLDGNATRILDAYERAEADGCDIAVFPELAITGYPPEDLLLKPGFVRAGREALDKVAAATGRCAAVVGFVDADRDLFNAAAGCADGRVAGTYHKRNLPNYAVVDEQR